MGDKTNIRTEPNKPFALLQVPPAELAALVEEPNVIDRLKAIIGVEVLIIGQDVTYFKGGLARDELERVHGEIEKFLDAPQAPEDMNLQEVAQEIARLNKRISGLQSRLSDLKQRRALAACPFNVGEILIDDKGQRAVVNQVNSGHWREESYSMVGRYFKKDGTVGKRICHFYDWDHWRREGENEETNEEGSEE